MKRGLSISVLILLLVAVALVLLFFLRELGSGVLATHPEVLTALEASLEDQKQLAKLEPDQSDKYRAHFETLQTLLQRLEILNSNQAALRSRYEMILLALMMAAVLSAVSVFLLHQSHVARRLDKIRSALEELAEGRPSVKVRLRGFDVTSKIAAMIERTSRIMTADKKRLATLRNLSAWQEAARRHAHEMRTPLTGARLEISRLMELARRRQSGQSVAATTADNQQLAMLGQSALREIDRLSAFSREFTSFAQLRSPTLEAQDLGSYIEDFCRAFAGAWNNLELVNEVPLHELSIGLDRNMIRQVLGNLCDNSSHASPIAAEGGKSQVRFSLPAKHATDDPSPTLWVSDEGSGIAPSVHSTLFEPYTTTKSIGSGMGLGLAICKKIMLDHGGDLELGNTGPAGTTFHLIFAAGDLASAIKNPHDPPAKEPSDDRSLDR